MDINEDTVKNVLSSNIKSARINSNLTQDELAEKSEISSSFLKDIENARSSASLVTFLNLCKALNTSPSIIFKDFFASDNIEDINLQQQISLLTKQEKSLLYILIHYFNNEHRDK